jgi:predicted RNase H-like nuclease (RuvC/YqgF family)
VLSKKKDLEVQLKKAEESTAEARRELDSLKDTKRKLELDLEGIKSKRQESLTRGKTPCAEAALASLPSDIQALSSPIAEKTKHLESLSNSCSSLVNQLNSVGRELERFDLHARRDAVHEKMRKVLLEWNGLVGEMLDIRKDAGLDGLPLQVGCLNGSEYPIFPIGVKNPGWQPSPELCIELLAIKPTLNFAANGKQTYYSNDGFAS